MLPKDLPEYLPSFVARFGSDGRVGPTCLRRAGRRGFAARPAGTLGRGAQGAADRRVRVLRQAAFAPRRDHLRADQDRARPLVSRDLPGDLEQGRDLRDGTQAADGLRQLSDRLELAGQDQEGDGGAGPPAAGGAGRGGRDLRWWPETRPPGGAVRPGRPSWWAPSRAAAAGPEGAAWAGCGWRWCLTSRPRAWRVSSPPPWPSPPRWPRRLVRLRRCRRRRLPPRAGQSGHELG
ncbi:MAG: hypothetical protein K0R41_1196 [Geminicoccaceae bacterium]|nr:hypothetical protein [Geminicoccaceae bacterium]